MGRETKVFPVRYLVRWDSGLPTGWGLWDVLEDVWVEARRFADEGAARIAADARNQRRSTILHRQTGDWQQAQMTSYSGLSPSGSHSVER